MEDKTEEDAYPPAGWKLPCCYPTFHRKWNKKMTSQGFIFLYYGEAKNREIKQELQLFQANGTMALSLR